MKTEKTEMILEFDKIKESLIQNSVSQRAKAVAAQLKPYCEEDVCKRKIAQTTQARKLLDEAGTPPLSAMEGLDQAVILCEKGAMLSAQQLEKLSVFIASGTRLKAYLFKNEAQKNEIVGYGNSIYDLAELKNEIDTSIQNGKVLTTASAELRSIRRKIENADSQIRRKMDEILRAKKNCFSDSYVSQRNGRFVLPVKKECKNQISGTVLDISSTGSTCFIEPTIVSKWQEELTTLHIEEENEIRRILYCLSGSVEAFLFEIKCNMEAMEVLDCIFAKAKLSAQMKASPASIDRNRTIIIEQGYHPLLKREICVPLDISIGNEVDGIIITGPNTGGKTVALKTVGLLSLMVQSGLHVPVKKGKFCMNQCILCDIGDGQSISENLSTFSSHMSNVIQILETATSESLILLDELGSGTDPAEGMGIAIAILEELRAKGCLFVATTHYPQVKEYAEHTEGVMNARMAFDRESLMPLYRLEIGSAGQSCALYIAQRLGFPAHMVTRAEQAAYYGACVGAQRLKKPQLQIVKKKPALQKDSSHCAKFQLGDSVTVHPQRSLGIVYQCADEKGMVGVQIKGEKQSINYKRLSLKVAAKELYPPDYDFSILFDTVENRKIRHKMEKGHQEGLGIEIIAGCDKK